MFKSQAVNADKVCTGGLFAYARFINHTGHVLFDFKNLLMSRLLFLVVPALVPADLQLLTEITQGTMAHVHVKYGVAYNK